MLFRSRIADIDAINKKITLSVLDPNKYFPYSARPVTVLSAATTASSGATGIVLETSDDYNVTPGDVIQVDSEKMLVNWIVGATGVWNTSVTRGYSSTSVASHTKGATAYNTTDHRFKNWRIYITSADGEGQFSKVTSYTKTGATAFGATGWTGVIGYSGDYTLNASGSTAPTTNSTYYLMPDFLGATGAGNDGYYTTGSTGVNTIKLVNAGAGYTGGAGYGVRVDISAPLGSTGFGYAIPRTAGATAVVTSGSISSITITDPGSYYLFAPTVKIVQVGATGGPLTEAKAYATIVPNTVSQEEQSSVYSESRGRVLN